MIEPSPYSARGYRAVKFEPHLHTVHSDGRDTVWTMLEACQAAGYQAVALTDHNTMSGLAEAETAAAQFGLMLVPGVEVTTFRGHAIALGVTDVPEWRDLEHRGMDSLARNVHHRGGLLSLAHPASVGSPVCSGCAWDWPVQPGSIDLFEIFSAPRPATAVPLALWRQMLVLGGRSAPVAAGDVHSRTAALAGRAATYVYTRALTRDGVLEGLAAGRVSASRTGPLDFWLERPDGEVALMGEGVDWATWAPHTTGADVYELTVRGKSRCLYAEAWDDHGDLEAVSAPIWITTSQ